MTDSMVSGFSMVSIGGEDVSAEKAIDESIADIQSGLNETHSGLRIMLMSDERGDSFEETKEDYDRLYSHIKELQELIKDLHKIVKQVQPRPPKKTKKDEQKDQPFATAN